MAVREHLRRIGLDVRAGVHAGECEESGGKLVGIAVHIGARVLGIAEAGEVLASSTVGTWSRGRESSSTIAVTTR